MKKILCVSVALAWAACGGSSTSTPTPVVSVGGDYAIQKTVTSDGCAGSTGTFTNPGTVRHVAGASSLVLSDHGTRDLPGSIEPSGAFQLVPYRGPAGGVEGTDTFDAGQFRTGGFAMRVTTVVLRSQGVPPAADCTIVTDWAGTKQGSPNVIP